MGARAEAVRNARSRPRRPIASAGRQGPGAPRQRPDRPAYAPRHGHARPQCRHHLHRLGHGPQRGGRRGHLHLGGLAAPAAHSRAGPRRPRRGLRDGLGDRLAARARGRDPLNEPFQKPRQPNRVLPYLVCFGVPLATFAAFLTAFTVSSSYGRETERLERAGYDQYEVRVVRLTGKPEFQEGDEDIEPYYLTDLTLLIPYEDGPREVTVPGMFTRHEPPVPGSQAPVYYAPRDPGTPVTENGERSRPRLIFVVFLGIWIWPLILAIGGGLKAYAGAKDLHRLRRFRPEVHLPALGILLTGLALLVPTALEFEVAGYARPLAFLSCLTPALAVTWVVRTN